MSGEAPIPVALFARVSKEAQDFGRQLVDTQAHADRSGYQVVAVSFPQK